MTMIRTFERELEENPDLIMIPAADLKQLIAVATMAKEWLKSEDAVRTVIPFKRDSEAGRKTVADCFEAREALRAKLSEIGL